MSTKYSVNEGADTITQSLTISGSSGAGVIYLPEQSAEPSNPEPGNLSLFANNNALFSWKDADGYISTFDSSTITSDRVWTLPDASDTLVSENTTAILYNKTILSTDGNVIEATKLSGAPIVGAPADGDILSYNDTAGEWQPLSLAGTSPLNYSAGTFSVATGSTAGTVAVGNDARFSAAQRINVKRGTAGAGEYTSIASAVASISDAGMMKPYEVYVYPGLYIEPAITIPQYVTVRGQDPSNTIVIPTSNTITQFTLLSNAALKNVALSGLGGTGKGVVLDNADYSHANYLVVRNFSTCIEVKSSVSASNVILRDILCHGSYTYGIRVDGTALTSAAPVVLNLFTIFCSATSVTVDNVRIEGPYANVTMTQIQSVGAVNGNGINILDGATINLSGSQLRSNNNGFSVSNVGAAPSINAASVTIINSGTRDLNIVHPGTTGQFAGVVDRTKSYIDAGSDLSIIFTDPNDSGVVIVGDFVYTPVTNGVYTEHGALLQHTSSLGIYAGGIVSAGAGLSVDITGGSGYSCAGSGASHQLIKTTWSDTSLVLSADTTNYIYVDQSGGVLSALSLPDPYDTLILARVRTTSTDIEFIDLQRYSSYHPNVASRTVSRNAIGALYSGGSIVTADGARQLSISSGSYYYLDNEFNPAGHSSPATWSAYYHSGGVFVRGAQTVVDNAQYDDGVDLVALSAGQFTKHSLYTVGDGLNEKYFLVYGRAEFASLLDAQTGDLPDPPSYFGEGVILIAAIIVQQGASSVSDILDLRPSIGSSGSSFASATDHGSLTGLLDDDHMQYLLVNGTRAMTGHLDLGTNNIINAGSINGVSIASHASRHLPNGADPLATAAPLTTLSASTPNSVGTANSFARSDHTHAFDQSTLSLNSIGGTLSVSKGGTGASSLTAGNFVVGNGTSAVDVSKVVPGGEVVGTTDSQSLSNKNLVDSSTLLVNELDPTKAINFDVGGGAPATQTTIVSSQSANRTLTLPDLTDTLVGRATIDTLTNKTLTSPIISTITNVGTLTLPTSTDTLVGRATIDTLTNKTLNSPVISSISNTGTLTLPTSTDTLVGRATVDTLTNKTITGATNTVDANALKTTSSPVDVSSAAPPSAGQALIATSATTASWQAPGGSLVDSQTFVVDNTDITKKLNFDVGGTTETTLTLASVQSANRTLTFPDITDTLVTKTTTDNLTNKTITGATNTVDANALKTTGTPVNVSSAVPPSAGQVLTATSATTATWQAPGSSLVDTQTFVVDSGDTTKKLGFDVSGTTGTTLTLASAQTANRTLTFPDSTDTLVGRTTVDTLTNKTLTLPVISTISNTGTLTLPTTTDTLVGRATIDTLTNKTLVSPIISAISNTGTLTLPTSTDTLVGRNTTDTLTNKTITGATNTVDANALKTTGSPVNVSSAAPPSIGQALIATSATTATWQAPGSSLVDTQTFVVDSGDTTKKLGFDVSGTTGTTLTLASAQTANHTLTFPDATDTLVGRATIDTLTNKTLTSPVISTISNTGTLTLPSATDTLVGRATVDTLTNKTITGATNTVDANALKTTGSSVSVSSAVPPSAGQVLTATSATTATWQAPGNALVDNQTFVVDNTDITSKLGFDVSGTTGTTLTIASAQSANRTLTLPDLTDTLVGRATVDTLTNKTLTLPVISSISNGGTLTLPSTTDTLVGRATADTLTNKILTAPVIATITNSGTLTLPVGTDTLVGRATADTLTNKTLTAPVISTITNSGTLTLPTATDTLVGRATTDTLTNKTITGSTNVVDANALKTTSSPVNVSSAAPPTSGQVLTATSATTATWQAPGGSLVDSQTFVVDSIDATKKLGFDVSGTTGTTLTLASAQTSNHTLTLPDATDTLVGRATVDTLTNKTLTAPIISTITNTGTLTLPTSTDTLVGRATSDTLTNKTLTSPVISSIINAGTLTLPTSTDTLVGRATVDTLTNKTLTSPIISTISNTGTLTLPTSTDTLVGRNTTDTLTNKTITGATNTVDANALKTTGASVTVSGAAPPTAGQVLTATSATAAAWQAPGGSLADSQTYVVDSIDATKRLGFDVSGTTGTTTVLATAQTSNCTLTLPDITDTLVTKTTIDSLTNKTIVGVTNTVEANSLKTTTFPVNVSGSAPPNTGYALIATSSTAATWQAPGGSLVDNQTFVVDSADPTKKLGFDVVAAPGTTLTLASSHSANRTLTLPDITDTIITRTTVDPLTNKTLTDASNNVGANSLKTTSALVDVSGAAPPTAGQVLTATSATAAAWQAPGNSLIDNQTFIVDAADNTSKIGFSINGSSGTTLTLAAVQNGNRTITFPDLTDTLVGRATIDTLTNKTLTSPVISTITNVGTLTLPDTTDTLVGRATVDTLTNKTLTAPIISTISNVGTLTLPTATGTLVGRTTVDTLTNKTLTAPVISTIVNVGTLTLPTSTDTLVGRATTDTLTNKTLTAPVISSITNVGTLTLPTSTDTLVGRATTDTLTNKTITGATNTVEANSLKTTGAPVVVDAANQPQSGQVLMATSTTSATWQAPGNSLVDNQTFIVDGANINRKIAFNVAGTTGTVTIATVQTTNRTLTLPDATDTLVGRATVDTLTNKTLTSPVISTISNTGTLTLPTSTDTLVGRATSDTLTNKTITGATNTVDANALKTTGASVNVSSAAPPTTGQVLTATSATAATWQSLASVSMATTTLTGTISSNNNNLSFTITIDLVKVFVAGVGSITSASVVPAVGGTPPTAAQSLNTAAGFVPAAWRPAALGTNGGLMRGTVSSVSEIFRYSIDGTGLLSISRLSSDFPAGAPLTISRQTFTWADGGLTA